MAATLYSYALRRWLAVEAAGVPLGAVLARPSAPTRLDTSLAGAGA